MYPTSPLVSNLTGVVDEHLPLCRPTTSCSIMERISNGVYLHGVNRTSKSSHLEYIRFIALKGWDSNVNSHIKKHCSKGLTVI